ncbi:uncharacterized protein LOC131648924 [Vicia villosa]|uniref:uncharacterized protein LOC131648924 n=1 Tax=Vicia villosa TaxID=3911 RepID=UPI00273C30D0|nr:uncharacterized protein LOC131648924 [Vicia villosa]
MEESIVKSFWWIKEVAWSAKNSKEIMERISERKGARYSVNHSDIADFSDSIGTLDLVDLPAIGNKFSWFNLASDAASRLDRFLVSEGLIDAWDLKGQCIGDISLSNHCPMSIKANRLNWGPKPFRFFSVWIDHPEFLPLVAEVFGKLDLLVEDAVRDLNVLDRLVAKGDSVVNAESIEKRREAHHIFWEKLCIRESILRQKSRCNWLKEGDRNSIYFHSFMKTRFRRNSIVSIKTKGFLLKMWKVSNNRLPISFSKDFRYLYSLGRPILEGVPFNQLSAEDNTNLELSFSLQDIKDFIWNPQSFNDYCPIYLISSVYRIIPKLLADR